MNTTFERTDGKEEWLTPPSLLKQLGEFDLDPCSPVNRPWDTAKKHYTKLDNGLMKPWKGRIWCNPPYGDETHHWVERLAGHGNGIALIFARVDTKLWQDIIFPMADSLVFLRGRITFLDVTGKQARNGAGCASALVCFGKMNTEIVFRNDKIDGAKILLQVRV